MPDLPPPPARLSDLPAAVEGALLMAAASALFAVMNLLIQLAAAELHPLQVAFLRILFGLLFMLPWLARAGLAGLRTARLRLFTTRAITGLAGMLTWFAGLSLMPLAEAVALSFTTPLFTTIGAALVLRETVRGRRWIAIAAGFVGVLILVRPGAQALSAAALLVLLSAVFNAGAALQVKTLARTESSTAMVTYMVLLMTPMALVPALFVWQWPSWRVLGIMVVIGAIGSLAHLAVTRAFRLADASAVAPLDYVKLPVSALLGWLAFGEVMGPQSWAGAAVIAGAALYVTQREAALARRGPGS